MSRRSTDQPPPERLAALLGVAMSGAPPSENLDGWVPARDDVELTAPPRQPVRRQVRRQVPAARKGAWLDGGDGRHRRPAPPRPRLLTVPVSLRGASVRPRRTAVLGLVLVLVRVTAVLGVRLALARSSATPEPVPAAAHGPPAGLQSRSVPAAFATSPGAAAGTGTATGAGGRAPAASPAPGGAAGTASGVPGAAPEVVVHVVGAVARAGVVRLPPGSRVLDAVTAAGGASAGADLAQLNLARPVLDGEQVHVPRKGETLPVGASSASGTGIPRAVGGAGGVGAPGGVAGGGGGSWGGFCFSL